MEHHSVKQRRFSIPRRVGPAQALRKQLTGSWRQRTIMRSFNSPGFPIVKEGYLDLSERAMMQHREILVKGKVNR